MFDEEAVLDTEEVGRLEGELLAGGRNAAEGACVGRLPVDEGDDAIAVGQHMPEVGCHVGQALVEACGEGAIAVAAGLDQGVVAAELGMEVPVDCSEVVVDIEPAPKLDDAGLERFVVHEMSSGKLPGGQFGSRLCRH